MKRGLPVPPLSSSAPAAGARPRPGFPARLPAAAPAPVPRNQLQPRPAARAVAPPATPQRVGIVGDSDFLSNVILAQAGNGKLGLNLIRWLASRDEQLDINLPTVPDQSLSLSPTYVLMLELAFLLVLPLFLLTFGIGRWLSRRRR